MNFKQNSLFTRNTGFDEEQADVQGGVLAVWGSPSSGKTTVSVKLADYLARKKKNVLLIFADMTTPPLPCICAAGDLEARNILVEHNLRLVAHIIKKYYTQSTDQEDLISIGTIGLIKAVNTFRPDKGIKLATYAARCIENEILMYFRGQKKLQGEVSLNEALDTGPEGDALYLGDVVGEEDTMLEELQSKEDRRLLHQLLARELTPREADVLRRRYGLDGHLPQTQRQVAAHYGISRSYVSRIEKKALHKLEEALRDRR